MLNALNRRWRGCSPAAPIGRRGTQRRPSRLTQYPVMNRISRSGHAVKAALLLFAIPVALPQNTPAPPPQQPSPWQNPAIRAIRFKLSAADLDSAESLLEEYKSESGTDTVYILGASWVARGGALLRNWDTAERYSALTRELCGHPTDPVLQYALGSAIEVHAQVLNAQHGKNEAVAYLDDQLKLFHDAPVSFRCRLYKRRNLTALVGQPAPAITADDGTAWTGAKGKPAIVFIWAHYCSDCLGNEAELAHFWRKYRDRGIRMAALTRVFDDDDAPADKAKTAEVWHTSYGELSDVPVILSTAAMLRYGGSSTPTFVFIDAHGIVRAYLPWRLTGQRLAEEADKLLH